MKPMTIGQILLIIYGAIACTIVFFMNVKYVYFVVATLAIVITITMIICVRAENKSVKKPEIMKTLEPLETYMEENL